MLPAFFVANKGIKKANFFWNWLHIFGIGD